MHPFRKRKPHSDRPLPDLDLTVEMNALTRDYAGLINLRRIEWLGGRMGQGRAVHFSDCGFCGDRLALWLDDDSILTLRLLWPERRPIALLTSIRWVEGSGWDVTARSTEGELVSCSAWRATLTLASERVSEHGSIANDSHRRTSS